ncbi:hypothetical protein EDEG_03645 [Edhazardia aedis USNM 41457]|uniref:Uncharacterized protein n=1 Tax=Edhazardia aedis (strain USNM 41457) TaxID=1003232 RepID=J9D1Y1_EDHAE|nr:hypothetical protein EDEG_03645 [Edhazardia aedis USNM 41457]|eukprot:EJW01871.1 hypothetical protein EDEG_03645 [Edhazardia aedis USNM 41457]
MCTFENNNFYNNLEAVRKKFVEDEIRKIIVRRNQSSKALEAEILNYNNRVREYNLKKLVEETKEKPKSVQKQEINQNYISNENFSFPKTNFDIESSKTNTSSSKNIEAKSAAENNELGLNIKSGGVCDSSVINSPIKEKVTEQAKIDTSKNMPSSPLQDIKIKKLDSLSSSLNASQLNSDFSQMINESTIPSIINSSTLNDSVVNTNFPNQIQSLPNLNTTTSLPLSDTKISQESNISTAKHESAVSTVTCIPFSAELIEKYITNSEIMELVRKIDEASQKPDFTIKRIVTKRISQISLDASHTDKLILELSKLNTNLQFVKEFTKKLIQESQIPVTTSRNLYKPYAYLFNKIYTDEMFQYFRYTLITTKFFNQNIRGAFMVYFGILLGLKKKDDALFFLASILNKKPVELSLYVLEGFLDVLGTEIKNFYDATFIDICSFIENEFLCEFVKKPVALRIQEILNNLKKDK